MPPKPHIKSTQQGVVILEVMIAILIFSMGVLSILGLQAAMIKNTADSEFRTEASYLAQQQIGLLWAGSAQTVSASGLPSGSIAITQSGVQYTVTVSWLQPGAASGVTAHNFTTTASITP